MRLLVTRPEPDATALKAHLIAQGHEVRIEPLVTIDLGEADPIELEDVQALIATSRNGLRALAKGPALDAARRLPVFCVGPGTASTAKAIGLQRVIEGPRGAGELLPLIAEHAEVNGGPLMHLAGDTVTPGFLDELIRLGFHVLQPVVYTTRVATRFAASTVADVRNGRVDGVLLLSPRTAAVYARLVRRHKLESAARRLTHFCLSSAVSAALAPLGCLPTAVAAQPNLKEMLALTAPGAALSAKP
jgi:uroporphyrinogen-III synthase